MNNEGYHVSERQGVHDEVVVVCVVTFSDQSAAWKEETERVLMRSNSSCIQQINENFLRFYAVGSTPLNMSLFVIIARKNLRTISVCS